MRVRRVVPNLFGADVAAAKAFYVEILGMEVAMDMGWIVTFVSPVSTVPQLNVASEGGSGTVVPDVSIEVDDLDEVHRRVVQAGLPIEYGPVHEPWGVRRFYVRDPLGRLINLLTHVPARAASGEGDR